MRLYVIRHAEAEAYSSAGTDFARELTARGRKGFLALSQQLCPKMEPLSHLIHSPRVRAVQTASLLAELHSGTHVLETPELDSGRPVEGHVKAILDLAQDGAAGVALIAHEPEVGELAGLLLGSARDHCVVFEPGETAYFEIVTVSDVLEGHLAWKIPPA